MAKYLVVYKANDGISHVLNVGVVEADSEAGARVAGAKQNGLGASSYPSFWAKRLDDLSDGWSFFR